MRNLRFAVLASLLLGLSVSAQSVIYGPGSTRAFETSYTGPQTMVRDSKANLYVIYRYAVNTLTQWDLAIGRSTDNGATWNMTWQTGFANLGTDFGNYHPCIAIDSQDNLHCAWMHRVAFTGSRLPATIHYNRFEAANSAWGTEWAVTSSAVYERPNPVLAVDSNDYVWLSHGDRGWSSVIKRSNMPYASDGNFSAFTPAFPNANSQHVSMVLDAQDRLHITYYDTGSGYAGIKHQVIDPLATTPAWTLTSLSNHGATNHTSRAEYHSRLSADAAGNVYAIYNVDDQAPSSGRTGDTETYVRKWDGTSATWGMPVLVQGVPSGTWAPASGANDGRHISCVVDEGTGELYFTYRDFTSGQFNIGRWNGDDTETSTIYANLMNTGALPANTRNYFFLPHMRGSLWPVANRMVFGLNMTYAVGDQTAATPVYTNYFENFPVASLTSTAAPQIGTSFPISLNSVSDGGKSYQAALCVSGAANTIGIDRRYIPLTPDTFFFVSVSNLLPSVFVNFLGTLSGSGAGSISVVIPNDAALVGIKAHTTFVTFPGGPAGISAISNAYAFTIQT